jgi:hypothetical protein
MAQKYIEGDFVMYDNKIMLIKEPRDGSHFDLSCPTEGLVYCLVNIDEIKPIPITVEILKKNGWKKEMYHDWYYLPLERTLLYIVEGTGIDGAWSVCVGLNMSNIASISFIHQLQHLLFGLGINHEMEV